ncbi:MAG TPA: hypothetical protein VKR58_14860 [Aquella sp.]|nr:hypothetical protein [Aquella sp.]
MKLHKKIAHLFFVLSLYVGAVCADKLGGTCIVNQGKFSWEHKRNPVSTKDIHMTEALAGSVVTNFELDTVGKIKYLAWKSFHRGSAKGILFAFNAKENTLISQDELLGGEPVSELTSCEYWHEDESTLHSPSDIKEAASN